MQEARERVRAAIRNAGYDFPLHRITVNLAPADVRKEGPIYDLPIAVGVLIASEQIEDRWAEAVLLGELSLDGRLRHVNGVLPLVAMCAERSIEAAVVPVEDLAEARMVAGVRVHGLGSLTQLKTDPPSWAEPAASTAAAPPFDEAHDIAVVQGQEHVKRAFEVAAVGGYNLMLQGPPGSGKTLLARAMPGLLPPLTPPEALEVTKVYSVAGMIARDQPLIEARPFRAPHPPSRTLASSVGAPRSGRGRSRSRIEACSSSMSSRSSPPSPWSRSVNPSSPAW